MKVISKLKLNQISKADLEARQMNRLFGGTNCCGCGCHYANSGGSSLADNGQANEEDNKTSYGGDLACGYSGTYEVYEDVTC